MKASILGLPENGMEVQAETDTTTVVVVTVARIIPVTIGRAAIPGIIVPRTATQLNPVPYPTYSTYFALGKTPKSHFYFPNPRFARIKKEKYKMQKVKEQRKKRNQSRQKQRRQPRP